MSKGRERFRKSARLSGRAGSRATGSIDLVDDAATDRAMKKTIAVYVLAFGGGFVIMSLELLGGRVLAPYFGGSIYVWGSIITVFMLALSAGYLLGGYLSLKRPNVHKLGLILLVAGVLVCPLVLIAEPAMAWIFDRVEDPRYGSLLASVVLFMPPTIILGMISPYAVRLLVRATEESGRVAGTLYFVSTFGSALGTLGTSFYFVLWFELNTIVAMLAAVLVLLACLAFAAGRIR